MGESLASYTPDDFAMARSALLRRLLENPCATANDSPKAVLLGGQSGAGKTALHVLLKREFQQNAIVINGDEYRSCHPHYRELDTKYGSRAVSHTASWAGEMTGALIDALSVMQYNLIVEGTLRTSKIPLGTALLLRERGYKVSLVLMAVKPEISLISCQIRYEQMRLAGTIPRATDPEHHNEIVHKIVGNLDELEQSGLFDEIRLYSRSGECAYPIPGDARTACEALQEILFGPWTIEEQEHYRFLQAEFSRLKNL